MICPTCGNFYTCSVTSLRTRTVRTNAKKVGRGTPSAHSHPGLGVIRAVCRVRLALKVYFRAGKDKTIPRLFFTRRYFVPDILHFSKCCFFVHTCLFQNGTACPNYECPVQGQVWGTLSSKFGGAACRVSCVTRACAVCNAMFFFFNKNQAAGPNSLGASLTLRTRVRAPASVSCLFFFACFFFAFFLFVF